MSRAGFWRIRTVDVTGSTNADLAAAARDGEPEGAVLVAGQQTAGNRAVTRLLSVQRAPDSMPCW